MKKLTFYRCNICGNLICMVNDSGVTPTCCGEEMDRVIANTADTSIEKHVPCLLQEGNRILISIGSLPHPMTKEHYIEWIILQTNRGTYTRRLLPENKPEVCFHISADEYPGYVWCMCNIHGLWLRNVDG